MATLKPFRQISENDVVNLYAFDGSAATRGHIVKLSATAAKGWQADDNHDEVDIGLGINNTVSDRFSVKARVETCTSGDVPFGMLMYDVAETDENGEKLIFHPRKAHEMQVALSGQAVPVLTRGIVLVNGVTEYGAETVAAGVTLYAGPSGGIITQTTASVQNLKKVGVSLGSAVGSTSEYGQGGDVLIKLNCDLDR